MLNLVEMVKLVENNFILNFIHDELIQDKYIIIKYTLRTWLNTILKRASEINIYEWLCFSWMTPGLTDFRCLMELCSVLGPFLISALARLERYWTILVKILCIYTLFGSLTYNKWYNNCQIDSFSLPVWSYFTAFIEEFELDG